MIDFLQSLHINFDSSDQFLPTPITYLPTGRERGQYLAVYIGLSFLQVAFIDLHGDQQTQGRSSVRRTLEKAWLIEEHLRRDNATALFEWIGDCIAEVVMDRLANPGGEMFSELKIGISICLPIKQKSLDEAILMPTVKGFALKSDLNLRQALFNGYERHTWSLDEDRKFMPTKRRRLYRLPTLKIAAISNDTIATLASLAYSIRSLPNTRVVMGLVVGAGCNAAVPMRFSEFHKPEIREIQAKEPNAVETLVSAEWACANAVGPLIELDIVTEWDRQLDSHSARPGFHPLEYMVCGQYIGELVRIVSYNWFCGDLKLPHSTLPSKLVQEYSLSTEFLSLTVASSTSDEELADKLSQELQPPSNSDWEWKPSYARALRVIAWTVQNRAAALLAAAIVGLLVCTEEVKMQKPISLESNVRQENDDFSRGFQRDETLDWHNGPEELVVAYSGGVIQHYPAYKDTVQKYIDQLIIRAGPQEGGKSVLLREATDGGIVGTGVLAGIALGYIREIIGSAFETESNESVP